MLVRVAMPPRLREEEAVRKSAEESATDPFAN